MKNLKEKVLNIFNGSNNIEDTINEVNNILIQIVKYY